MFSSLLPNVSSSMKFAQNGPSKPSNRFSVRVFKTGANGPLSYPVSAKPDLGYRAPPPPPPPTQREQQNSNWYPTNSYSSYDQRPRGTANFSIYPSANGDTFIYEQSTCSKSDIFSTSEFDSSSTTTFSPSSAFSPTLSSDSTLALQSTPLPERSVNDQRTRPLTPAPHSGYTHGPAAPQGAPLSRTASTSHHIHEASSESIEEHWSSLPGRSTTPFRIPMPSAVPTAAMARVPSVGGYIQLPEYAASSMSELEVDERDRLAKVNAEYNAAASASSASFYTSSATTPHGSPTSERDYLARVASSQPQPSHPNLHFPVRPSESDFAQPAFYSTNTSHNAVIHDSPPTVERISSQLPPEYQVPHAHTPSPPNHSSPASDTRVRDNVYKTEPSYRTSPKNHNESFDGSSAPSSRSAHATYGTSVQETTTSQDYHQDRSHRRSSVVGPRPDLASLRPLSEVRDYGLPHPGSDYRLLDMPTFKSGSDSSGSTQRDYSYRDRRDVVQSPIRESVQTSPRDASRHESLGSELRRDARTPAPRESDDYRPLPPSRRDSYAPEAPRSPKESRTQSQIAKEVREGSEPRRDARTPSSRESDDYRPLSTSRRNSYAPEAPRSPRDSRTQSQPARETREVYKPGPLSSSPTQMRLSPADLEPPSGRQPGSAQSSLPLTSENERSHGRPRSRANSFSTSARPSLPVQSGPSDSRHASDYERVSRTSERTTAFKDEESFQRVSHGEADRRGDLHTSSSQAYYTQTSAVPLPAYESQSSQRQTSTSHQSSSRAIDRTVSSQQNTVTSHSRAAAQEPLTSSRSRMPYPEPEYPADSSRGRSDGDRQFTTSTQPSRNAAPYEQQQPTGTAKYADAAGNVRTITTVGSVSSEPRSEPQRRYSDGDQSPPIRPQLSGRNSAPLLRSVRWNDNLICPSPIFSSQRRKGWFNRRGDQLWTNDGAYKSAPAGQDYPADLDDYPEHGEGWMNEECVRIDLNHRLIPKAPLRSALKQSRA